MIAKAIQERLQHEPFRPFAVRTSSDKRYKVQTPALVVMMKSEVFIAAPNSDEFVVLPYHQIAGIEVNSNGGSDEKRSRR